MVDVEVGLVDTALGYPFPRADHSFLFADGEVLALADAGGATLGTMLAERGAAPMNERTAVLAYGANAAPTRLKRKFAQQVSGAVFPVLTACLFDFDIVYAGHFSSYGALPATPMPSPGTAVCVAVTYLDRVQLVRMHETELSQQSYVFGRLDGVTLALDGIGPLYSVHSYWSRHGSFTIDTGPLALASIAAEARRFAAAEQEVVQCIARDHLAPDCDLNTFITETASEFAICQERSQSLKDFVKPFDYPRCEILER